MKCSQKAEEHILQANFETFFKFIFHVTKNHTLKYFELKKKTKKQVNFILILKLLNL